MKRIALALAVALLVAGCGANEEPAPDASETAAPTLGAGNAKLPPQVADFPALASKDCADVVDFYFRAIGEQDLAHAALVWDDPVIDAQRLRAVFGDYDIEADWEAPIVEGAAGSLYCTVNVSGTLTDPTDSAAAAPVAGKVTLRRANDVPGATADQLRWTLQSSTFVEKLERSRRGEP